MFLQKCTDWRPGKDVEVSISEASTFPADELPKRKRNILGGLVATVLRYQKFH